MKKYQYRLQLKRLEDNHIFWKEWDEKLYVNKSEIENLMRKIINEKVNKWSKAITINYEIREVEINEMTIEGKVSDYGSYEDYTVIVDDTDIERLIINKFEGQKVRIKIEVIE